MASCKECESLKEENAKLSIQLDNEREWRYTFRDDMRFHSEQSMLEIAKLNDRISELEKRLKERKNE